MLIFAHGGTSLQTGHTPTMRALGRIGYRDDAFTASTNVVGILDFHDAPLKDKMYILSHQREETAFFYLSGHRFLIANENQAWYNEYAF